jgi:hypothetical protein
MSYLLSPWNLGTWPIQSQFLPCLTCLTCLTRLTCLTCLTYLTSLTCLNYLTCLTCSLPEILAPGRSNYGPSLVDDARDRLPVSFHNMIPAIHHPLVALLDEVDFATKISETEQKNKTCLTYFNCLRCLTCLSYLMFLACLSSLSSTHLTLPHLT